MSEIGDITENEGAKEKVITAQEELKLEEKLKMLSWAAESSTIGLITTDYSGILNYVNPVVPKMWGYGKEELLGRCSSEFWHSPSEVLKAGEECREKGEWTGELVARRKDGTLFNAHVSLSLIRNDAGKPIGLMGTCFDITERKRAENELKKRTEELSLAKQRLDLALEATAMGTWDLDVASNRLTWDERMFRLVGVTGGEFEQTHEGLMELSDKIMPPEDRERMMKALQEVAEGKTDDYELEHGVIRLDGSIRRFAVKGHAYRDSKGELLRLIGTTQDITERKTAEEALRKSEEDLSRAQSMAHLGNYSWNLQTDEISLSEELKSIWGCRPEEAPSLKTIFSRIHPDDREHVLERGALARKEGRSFNDEYRIVRPDGAVRYLQDHSELTRDEAGKTILVFGTTQDITDWKRMEEQLHRAREEAEAANRAKGEFLANMSHEIRTPMNALLGMMELLEETDLNEEQREYLKLAHLSSESLLSLIDDILDFSRIEQEKLELELIEFDLRSSISQIMSVMDSRAASGGIELISYVGADVPELVVGDPFRLKQVLFNLIANAVKFTEKGKAVLSVETCKVRPPDTTCETEANGMSPGTGEPDTYGMPPGTGEPDTYGMLPVTGEPDTYGMPLTTGEPDAKGEINLLFKVRDTGVGIHPENLDRIFDAFTQADTSVTRKYGGTGLGLAISSQLVELMGGRIRVESEVGKGSTFYFTIPVKRGAGPKTVPCMGAELWEGTGTGTDFGVGVEETPALKKDSYEKLFEVRQGEKAECPDMEAENKVPCRTALNILLVDDHLINQKLVVTLLEKKGHRVTLAGNGKEALSILSTKEFDVVLMDVQMPGMDGLEASRRIRDSFSSVKQHDIPIIALTARAMKEDRRKCLEAGMTDYLSKPLKKGELFRALEWACPGPAEKGTVASATPFSRDSDPVFYLERGLERTEGDEDLLREMVRMFLDTSPELLSSLEKALKEGDFEALLRDAHKLKSSAGVIGADRVFKAAKELEKTGRAEIAGKAEKTGRAEKAGKAEKEEGKKEDKKESRMDSISKKFNELKQRMEELEPALISFLSVQS